MTEQDKNMSEQNEALNAEAENQVENTEPQQPSLEDVIQEKSQRIEELEQSLAIAKKNESEAMVRARAEIDNVRKRVEQDVEKAHKFALEKFSVELLPVIDNLERAIASIDKENQTNQAVLEGLELTLKSFLDTVKKFGIEAVESDNVALNPDLHQAISMVESPDHQAGQIVTTIQKGYILNGRLIRPAMVMVAK